MEVCRGPWWSPAPWLRTTVLDLIDKHKIFYVKQTINVKYYYFILLFGFYSYDICSFHKIHP